MYKLGENINSLNIELKQKEDELNNIMDDFSNKVFKKIIIPFCKKYKLTFTQGMGTYFFKDNKNKILDSDCMKKSQKQKNLKIICNLLDTMDFNINTLVLYKLEDYK